MAKRFVLRIIKATTAQLFGLKECKQVQIFIAATLTAATRGRVEGKLTGTFLCIVLTL